MAGKRFDLLSEKEREVFLGHMQRFGSYTDIGRISDVLAEALNDLTSFRYSLLFLYQPEKNLLYGVGPVNRSPVIRKAEKFIGLEPTELVLDLTDEKYVKQMVRRKRPLELEDLESVDFLSKLLKKKKKQVMGLLNMMKIKKTYLQPILVNEGNKDRNILVGILFIGTEKDRIDKKEKIKVSMLSDQMGLFFHNELNRRRLSNEIEVKENNQRLFETINLTILQIQQIYDEDMIFRTIAERFKMANMSVLLVKRDRDEDKLIFRHMQTIKSLSDSMKKLHSLDMSRIELKSSSFPRVVDLFNLKKPIVIDDIGRIQKNALRVMGLLRHAKKFPLMAETRAGLVCPIRIRQRCDRIMIIIKDDISSSDLLPIEVFSLQISNVLERMVIERENKEKTEQIQFMIDLSSALSRSLNIDNILDSLQRELIKVVPFDHINLVMMDTTLNDGLRFMPSTGGSASKATLQLTIKEIEALSAIAGLHIGTGKMRQRGIPEVKIFDNEELRTRLVIPLHAKDHFLGLLNLGFKNDVSADQHIITTVTSIREPLSTAIQNAHVLVEERRRSDQLKIIAELSKMSTTVSSIESVFTEMLHLMTTKFGYHSAHLIKYHKDKNVFTVLMSSDPDIEAQFKKYTQSAEKGVIGRALRCKSTILVPNVEKDVDYVNILTGIRSELVVPILIDGEPEVFINLESEEYNDFDEQDILTIESIANEVSVLIKNIRMGKSEQKRTKQLALINEIGKEIITLFDEEKIMETTVSMIEEKFSYIDVTIFMVDDMRENLVLKAKSGFITDEIPIGLKVPIDTGIMGLTATKGESIILNNAQEDERYMILLHSEHRSELCCPIKIDMEVVGVINIESPMSDAFDKWDRVAMESLALEVGKALQKGIIFRETERKSKLLATVNDISLKLSKELESQKILEIFVENLQKSHNYLDVAVFLLDPKEDLLVKRAQSGDYKSKSPKDYSQKSSEGIFGVCHQRKETIVVNDVSKDKRFKSQPWVETRSEMVSPIIMEGEVVGVINVESDLLGAFNEWDKLAVDTISRNLAIALQNAKLLEKEKDRSDVLVLMNDVSSIALGATDLKALMAKTSSAIIKKFGFYNVSVFLEDETKHPLRLLSCISNIGAYQDLGAPGSEFPANEGIIGACFMRGTTVVVNDTTKDKRFVPEPRTGTLSELCVPLRSRDSTIGVLNIEDDKKGSFSQVEVITIETIADILSRAFQNMKQLEQLTRHSEDISKVMEIEKSLTSILEREDILKNAVKLIHDSYDFYNVEFYMIDEENYDFELFANKGATEKKITQGFRQNIDAGIIGQAYKDGRPLVVNEASNYSPYFESIGKSVKSAIAVPIVVEKKVIGILNVEGEEPNEFQDWDLLIMEAVGDLLAGALERANRYREHELRGKQYKLAYDIGMELSKSRSKEDLFKKAAKLIKSKLKFFHVEILSFKPGDKECTIVAANGGFKKKVKVGKKVPAEGCLIGWCLTEGSNTVSNDVTVDPRCVESQVIDVKSEIVALIKTDDKVAGLVTVKSKHFDAFSDWDLMATEAIIRQMENILWHLKE